MGTPPEEVSYEKNFYKRGDRIPGLKVRSLLGQY